MGVIQQGLNQALTGATFLLQQSPAMQELNKTRVANKEAEKQWGQHREKISILTDPSNQTPVNADKLSDVIDQLNQGSANDKPMDIAKKMFAHKQISGDVRANLEQREAIAGEYESGRELLKNPYLYSKYGDQYKLYQGLSARRKNDVDVARRSLDELSSAYNNYMTSSQQQADFRNQLKGNPKSDYDALVKMGINPNVAEAGIKQAEKRGEYNGKTNTKR